jgi:hypothetical protein
MSAAVFLGGVLLAMWGARGVGGWRMDAGPEVQRRVWPSKDVAVFGARGSGVSHSRVIQYDRRMRI